MAVGAGGVQSAHISIHVREGKREQEVRRVHIPSKPTPVADFLRQGPPSQRFHKILKQFHPQGTGCSNTRAHGGHFSFSQWQ